MFSFSPFVQMGSQNSIGFTFDFKEEGREQTDKRNGGGRRGHVYADMARYIPLDIVAESVPRLGVQLARARAGETAGRAFGIVWFTTRHSCKRGKPGTLLFSLPCQANSFSLSAWTSYCLKDVHAERKHEFDFSRLDSWYSLVSVIDSQSHISVIISCLYFGSIWKVTLTYKQEHSWNICANQLTIQGISSGRCFLSLFL